MLDRDEREIVQSLLPANDVDIDIVLERVYECAKEIERTSREPRWGWDRKEHHLCLSDQVGKMLKFLDKFKAVGDVIANVDPLHLGLPWAGIRIVLEVCFK